MRALRSARTYASSDPELAARQRVVDLLRHRADELRRASIRAPRAAAARSSALARHLVPAQREVRPDVGDERPFDAQRRVVPAELAARGMLGRVPAVAGERRQVDPADVRDPVVDDDRLLVVTVHRPLAVVERHADPRARASASRIARTSRATA